MRRRSLLGLAATAAAGAYIYNKEKPMTQVRFDLEKNIVETAKNSGIPIFNTRQVSKIVSYSIVDVPPIVQFIYTRPGFEIKWNGVFAFTMYADNSRSTELKVETINLQNHSDFSSHEEAKAFIEETIAQFQRGNWKRYFSKTNPRVTGRSSILDENDKIIEMFPAIDPDYKIPASEWIDFVSKPKYWRWIGDGIQATLDVSSSGTRSDGKSPDYDVNLDFDVAAIAQEIADRNQAEDLKDGDEKGWNSTAEHEAKLRKNMERRKRLEANAIKRGDRVVAE